MFSPLQPQVTSFLDHIGKLPQKKDQKHPRNSIILTVTLHVVHCGSGGNKEESPSKQVSTLLTVTVSFTVIIASMYFPPLPSLVAAWSPH